MRQSTFSNFILLILLMQLSGVYLVIAESLEDQPNVTESIKSKVKALKGKNVKVILLRSGKSVKGVIFDITDKDFKVGHRLDPESATIRYEEVFEIHRTKSKWFIYPLIAAGAIVVGLIIYQQGLD